MAFLHSGQGLSVGHGQMTDRPVGAAWLVHWQRLNVECECPLMAHFGRALDPDRLPEISLKPTPLGRPLAHLWVHGAASISTVNFRRGCRTS
jgi:hypothetical protein